MKLQIKIILLFMIIIISTSIIHSVAINKVLQNLQEEKLKSAEVVYATGLANEMYRQVIEEDVDSVTDIIFDSLNSREEKIEYVVVTHKNQEVFAHTYILNIPREIYELNNSVDGEGNYQITKIDTDNLESLDLSVPIMEGIEKVGTLHIGLKESYVENIITPTKQARNLGTLIAVITLLIGLVLAIALSKKIIHPIQEVTGAAEQVARGNLNVQLDIKGNDEISDLSRSIASMIKKLKKSKKMMDNYNKELERKVEERTKALRKKETMLERANIRLKALDVQKDNFISVAAHELKTPLTSIRGFTQLLLSDELKVSQQKKKEYLRLINQNTDRLYNLVCDVVDSSRISLGKIKINLTNIDTYQLYKETKKNLEIVIKEKGIKPTFSIEKNLPRIYADYERTLQILKNLLINAVHFTPEKGTVGLRVSKKEKHVLFEVFDTGAGIPKKYQKNLFSKFYQVDSSLRRKVGGSGLGLSVCKGLVENMKGKIWFESEEGNGSKFFFTLPATKETKK